MLFGGPSKGSGQNFTPNSVSKMMGKFLLNATEVEREVHRRLRCAILATPVGEALLMAWMLALSKDDGVSAFTFFTERVFPVIQNTYQPYTIADICSGSGVLLIGAMQEIPAWLTQFGLVEYHAFDIDARCVRMTHITLMLYGAASFIIRHQNSLSQEPDFTPPRYGLVRWLTPPEVVPPTPDLAPAAPPVRLPDLDLTQHTQLTLNL